MGPADAVKVLLARKDRLLGRIKGERYDGVYQLHQLRAEIAAINTAVASLCPQRGTGAVAHRERVGPMPEGF